MRRIGRGNVVQRDALLGVDRRFTGVDKIQQDLATQKLLFGGEDFREELFGMSVQCALQPARVHIGLRSESSPVASFPEFEKRVLQEWKCTSLVLHIGK